MLGRDTRQPVQERLGSCIGREVLDLTISDFAGAVDINAHTFKLRIKGNHLRYGFVGLTTTDECLYGTVNGQTFTVPADKQLRHLYLVVMGAPEKHDGNLDGVQYPYTFKVTNKK